jgi:hypothetical protein
MKRMKRRKYRKLIKKLQKKKRERNKSLGTHLGFHNKITHQKGDRNMSKNQPNTGYSLEDIYRIAGRDDKVAVLTFHQESEAFKSYGESLTVVFTYDIKEREALEKQFKENSNTKTFGNVKARPLVIHLEDQQTAALMKHGIYSKDIQFIFPSPWAAMNPYYKEEKRTLNKMEILIRTEPKGGDYDWMYGFERKLILNRVKLIPSTMELYLAMKLFFEPDKITEEEKLQIYDNNVIRSSIERKLLEIKLEKEVSTEEEEQRFFELSKEYMNSNLEILKSELHRAGTNLSKLYTLNAGLFHHLLEGTYRYIPEQLNSFEGVPIYLDWKGYVHVFIRHVKEFVVGERFNDKDKLLWHPSDIIPVIKNVISQVDDEIQKFWQKNPTSRFSKYGAQSLYFEGDYYTFHVEADGRISTFHSIKKMI